MLRLLHVISLLYSFTIITILHRTPLWLLLFKITRTVCLADLYLNKGVWKLSEVPLYCTRPINQLCLKNSWIFPSFFCSYLLSLAGFCLTLSLHSSLILISHKWSHIKGGQKCTISRYSQVDWSRVSLINLLYKSAYCPNFSYPYIPSTYSTFKR